MSNPAREKLDLFRAAKLLLANVQNMEKMRKEGALAASPADRTCHSALVAEFREKVKGLHKKAILILDRATDMKDRRTLREAILREADRQPTSVFVRTSILGDVLENMKEIGDLAGEIEPHCLPISPDISLVFPEWIGGSALEGYLSGLPAPVRNNHPPAAFGRITNYHEAFGHGTEGDEFEAWGDGAKGKRMGAALRANQELRADIAAIAGSFRDTGNANAAKAWIAVRDLAALRQTHQFFRKNARFSTEPVNYANGHILRKVLAEIEEKGPSFRTLDDNALLAFVDDAWVRHRLTSYDYDLRKAMLPEAYSIALEAAEGKTATHDRLKRDDPQLFREALAYLDDCADALCLLCKVDAKQLRVKPAAASKRRRGPSPRP